MRPIRLLPILGMAVLAVTVMLVREVRAASPQGIAKIVAAIKAGKMADAKAATQGVRQDVMMSRPDVEVQQGRSGRRHRKRSRPGTPRGIPAADLIDSANEDIGATTAAMYCPDGRRLPGQKLLVTALPDLCASDWSRRFPGRI